VKKEPLISNTCTLLEERILTSVIAIVLGLTTFIAGLIILFIGVLVVLRNLLIVSAGTNGGANGETSGTKSSNVWDAVIEFLKLVNGLNLKPKEGFLLVIIGGVLMGVGFEMVNGITPFAIV
jgi:hypothetical protein